MTAATFEQNLKKYANLIVKVGVNVQPGQEVYVTATTEVAPLARLVAREAYEAGASNVHVDWIDEELSRLKYEKAADEMFTEYPEYEALKRNTFVDKRAAFIAIVSSNPDLLKGIDPKRIGNFQKASGQALDHYRKAVQADKVSWTVVGAASADWAAKVFPDAGREEAVEKLWDAIFASVRLYADDPVQAWEEHNANLHKKVDILNGHHFHKLHYRAPGTDLTIELPEKHVWVGAGSTNEKEIPFMANMPTEEVFTVPKKDGVNGYVSSTKPLSYGGNLIDNFKLRQCRGRAGPGDFAASGRHGRRLALLGRGGARAASFSDLGVQYFVLQYAVRRKCLQPPGHRQRLCLQHRRRQKNVPRRAGCERRQQQHHAC